MSAVIIEPRMGRCPRCGVRRRIFRFHDSAEHYFDGCADCFQELMRVVTPELARQTQQTVVLRDLLYQAREALSRPANAQAVDALVEAIDVALYVE